MGSYHTSQKRISSWQVQYISIGLGVHEILQVIPAKIIDEQKKKKKKKKNMLPFLPEFAQSLPEFALILPEVCPNSYIGKIGGGGGTVPPSPTPMLKMYFHNCQSLPLHHADIAADYNVQSADICLFVETKLHASDAYLYVLQDFNMYRNDFTTTRSPYGSCIYYKSHSSIMFLQVSQL